MPQPDAARISREEIEEFSEKLQQWGAELSTRERGLLQLMLAGAQAFEPADVEAYAATSVKDAASAALESISDRILVAPALRPRSWVKVSPTWFELAK
jgi:hypothetical protein